MATSSSKLNYGSISINHDIVLGVGSYGKVCKAKCGQLSCAAKLLHDTMFEGGDPGIHRYSERFEQECQFLSRIKHPNIVQYLGTSRDQKSQRLALFMEMMDESLTRFLQRSIGSVPYHIMVNICHDVALALSYLHSNAIIHRDLSNNNVMLIGEGSRAKVTDFGMSKLTDINPRMTPLTLCPGAAVYMPPEALTNPPHYSSKLDCFSHGVLTIQIITRKSPNPGEAHRRIQDPNFPDRRLLYQVPEAERRREDINFVESSHPLLPIATTCLKDNDKDRPSADEVCGRLATLKREERYTRSVEKAKDQPSLIQRLKQRITQCQTEHQNTLSQKEREHQAELESEKTKYQNKLALKQSEYQAGLKMEKTRYQNELAKKVGEHQAELDREKTKFQTELEQKDTEVTAELQNFQIELEAKDRTIELLLKSAKPNEAKGRSIAATEQEEILSAPEEFSHLRGSAICHENIAYFSGIKNIYSISKPEFKWTKLPPCKYELFGMAVVNGQLTTVGGRTGYSAVNILTTLLSGRDWKVICPAMPSQRMRPAVVTTHTHLVVAGGTITPINGTDVVEVMNTNTLQWSIAKSFPQSIRFPQMTLHKGQIYLANDAAFFCCSTQDLLESCSGPMVWTRLADIPAKCGASLITLRDHVLAIGGIGDHLTAPIQCYSRATNSWSKIGQLPTPRSEALAAVLPSDEVIVAGGLLTHSKNSNDVYVCHL